MTGDRVEAQSRVVVDATGPWSGTLAPRDDGVRPVRLSKGVHILFPRTRLPLNHAVAFFSKDDDRALFAIPQANFVCVGTTDAPYNGRPEDVSPNDREIAYLLRAVQTTFPCCALSDDDIVDTWAGLRPLADGSNRTTSALRRDYRLEWRGDGLLAVVGGKMTLHRPMAARVVRELRSVLPDRSGDDASSSPKVARETGERERLADAFARFGLNRESSRHLLDTYDGRSHGFIRLFRENPAWAEPIVPSLPFVWAEIPFVIRYEMAVVPEDYLRRRTDFAVQCAAAREKVPIELYALWERETRVRQSAIPYPLESDPT